MKQDFEDMLAALDIPVRRWNDLGWLNRNLGIPMPERSGMTPQADAAVRNEAIALMRVMVQNGELV